MSTLFVSHGAPNLILHNSEARHFLEHFGKDIGKPRAILMVTAHFEAHRPTLTNGTHPPMIYDFGGFEPELRTVQYRAPGSPEVASEAFKLLDEAGLSPAFADRGFDHGTWVPLVLMRPEADIPVVQLSVEPDKGAAYHLKLGRALKPLADSGVLIIGSGAATHNLHEFFRGQYRPDSPAPDWVKSFGDWLDRKITEGDTEALVQYRMLAPNGAKNHPTEEHLLPLFVAMGAAGEGAHGTRVHTSQEYGVLMMDCYQFS
jgi:4,5-DOPA dioxygenase extradiol